MSPGAVPARRFPTADDTGVRQGLTLERSGPLTVTTPGTVLDGLEINGPLVIDADGVLVRNVRVLSAGARYPIRVMEGRRGVRIEDTEIVGADVACEVGLYGEGFTATRVEISGCQDGVRMGSSTTIEDSWVHDLRATDGSHNDAVQSLGGIGIAVRRNRLEGTTTSGAPASASIQLDGRVNGQLADVVVTDNFISGGAYALRIYNASGRVEVTGNVFERSWQYGPAITNMTIQVWSGNVDDAGASVMVQHD